MANLAQSAVAVNEVYKSDGPSARKFKVVDATLTLTGQGSLTNLIPATLFGMTYIHAVDAARDSSSNIVPAAPSYDCKNIVLGASAAETPADFTGILRLTVRGYE